MSHATMFQRVFDVITESKNILIVTHRDPDSDATGSLYAMSHWLESINKSHRIYCQEINTKSMDVLARTHEPESDWSIFKNETFDAIVTLDSSDLKITGIENELRNYPATAIRINIDHHISNLLYGDVNLIMPDAASTTEIIFRFMRHMNIPLSYHMANCLLIGIIGDTNNFSNPNATKSTFEIVSQLLRYGASLSKMRDLALPSKSLATLRLWSEAMKRMTINPAWQVAITVLTREDQGQFLSDSVTTSGLTNFLNTLTGIKMIVILFEEKDGIIKGSFRTNTDLIDVSKLATMLGGGGHRRAAGFTISGKLQEGKYGWEIV